MMKTMFTASLLALASTMAAAAPMGSGGTPRSLYTPEWGQGYGRGGDVGHALQARPTAGLTALDQFEQGNPDEVVIANCTGAAARATQPAVLSVTSLEQFEMGDPDTTPGG